MKKNTEAKPLFDETVTIDFAELNARISNFPYKDPMNRPDHDVLEASFRGPNPTFKQYYADDYDLESMKTKYQYAWQSYLTYAFLHGRPSNKKATNFFDTRKDRLNSVVFMYNYLRRQPTSKDLVEAFPYITDFDKQYLKAIDKDLKTFDL